MKILIVNTLDSEGGAAKAAYRLHKALQLAGVDSWLLVQNKTIDDYTVIGPRTPFQKVVAKVRFLLDKQLVKFYKDRTKALFSPSWVPFSNVVDEINEIAPDIVHLHWICRGMLRIEDLVKIKQPIVWTLHDMWPFTGGCHCDESCEAYKSRCGRCKVLKSKRFYDLSTWIWDRKNKIFSKKDNITIVGLSRWITNCAQKSSLFQYKKVITLPNPLDTTLFKPIDKKLVRQILNLPQDKKIGIFGSINPLGNLQKGFYKLKEALNKLERKDIEFIVFGSSSPPNPIELKYKSYYWGRLHDDISLSLLYNAADLMIVPSLQENLSNVIMEALSCGTPVVAFDIGGNSDLIDHEKNGYLAKPFDTADLAKGIEWILNNSEYEKLSNNARSKVLENFDSKRVASKYIKLYEEMISGGN